VTDLSISSPSAVEPESQNNFDFVTKMSELMEKREQFAVLTVIRTIGSTMAKSGFKMLVSSEGVRLAGTLGGACPEAQLCELAVQSMKEENPMLIRVSLSGAADSVSSMLGSKDKQAQTQSAAPPGVDQEIVVETLCGGKMDVFIEPFVPPKRLVLIGQGGRDDVEDALLRLGKFLGFYIEVVDPSPLLSIHPDRLHDDVGFDLRKFAFVKSDSVVVLTKGERDVPTLTAVLEKPVKPQYVGLLASKRRVSDDTGQLRANKVPQDVIDSIHAPAGADIGAVTPNEIALSIISEIIATRNSKTVVAKPKLRA
jgi:xanthine dehydrogenase accessory factor